MTDMMKEFGFDKPTNDNSELEAGNLPTTLVWACKPGAKALGWNTYEGKDENENSIYKPIELTTAYVDMPNFKLGWRKWVDSKPNDVVVKVGEKFPERPGLDWKPVIVMNMYSSVAKDFFTFASDAETVIRSVDDLKNTYDRREEKNQAPHLVPACTIEHHSFESRNGTLTVPNFKIVKYVSRPIELIADQGQAAATPAPAPAPAPAPKPAPVAPIKDEFNDSLDVLDGDDDKF